MSFAKRILDDINESKKERDRIEGNEQSLDFPDEEYAAWLAWLETQQQ